MNDSEHLSQPPETPDDGNEPSRKSKMTPSEIQAGVLLGLLGLIVLSFDLCEILVQ